MQKYYVIYRESYQRQGIVVNRQRLWPFWSITVDHAKDIADAFIGLMNQNHYGGLYKLVGLTREGNGRDPVVIL